ncbi:MAG TPA: ABC transporter permease [Vicinamibacterales bacterium]|nr:ABC transporter permease [Vicinamibacterales bacterium]
MDSLILDVKYAVRSILTAPKFAAVVLLTLALGIGANTAVFTVLNAVVLKPLPYAEPEQLVRVYHSVGNDNENTYLTGLAAIGYRDRSRTLDIAPTFTYSVAGVDITGRGEPERVTMLPVGADYFRVLRARPLLGQPFGRSDERPNANVAVVSERVWRKFLDARTDAIGETLTLNGIPYRIAAVLPDDFDDPIESGVAVWTPLNLRPGGFNSADNFYLSIIARLKPAVTIDQAQAELATLAAAMQPPNPPTRSRWSARVVPLQIDTVGSARTMLWLLLGAVGLLMVIACVNVASLLLARGAERETDLAVRAALGCSTRRQVRQLLIESVLLSLGGAIAGLVIAPLVTRVLLAAAPAAVAHAGSGSLERAVLAFNIALALVAGIGFGVAPAAQATRPDLEGMLREAGRSGGGSRRQTRARSALVVCQMALALVLLVGAGLLLRTFERLQSVALGVEPSRVMTFTVNLPQGRYGDAEQRARFHRDFQSRLAALPGVKAVGAVSRLPVTGSFHSWGVQHADQPTDSRFTPAQQRVVEGRYFDAVGIPLLRGRLFGVEDDTKAPRRVVVSEALVRQMFPSEDPIGKRLRVAGAQAEIIGVVGDVALGPRVLPRPYVYHSHSQFAADRNWSLTQVVALDRDPELFLSDAYRELTRIDRGLVLYEPQMLEDVVAGGVAQEQFALLLIASFAVLALVLAAVGVYGVQSYSVSRRSREMGIRLALGATPRSVRTMIVRDGGRLAVGGIALGCAGAIAATRFLQSLLFEVSATEPIVFAGAAALLAIVAVTASWIPAHAATKVNPLDAVRSA